MSDPAHIPKTFWDHCGEHPERIAIIEPGIRSWSRLEISMGSVCVRDHLSRKGVTEGQSVAIVAPNCGEFMIAYLGITLLGAKAVPVNFHLTDEEVAHVLRVSGAAVIVVHSTMEEKASRALCQLAGDGPVLLSLEALCSDPSRSGQSDPESISVSLPQNLGRMMLFTSATTGKPKAVAFSQDRGYSALERNIRFRELQGTSRDSNSVHLCGSMLYHAGPLEGAVVTLHMGNTLVVVRRWDLRASLQMIADYRVTEMYVVPAIVVQLAKIPEAERKSYDLSSLRMLIHGGAPCPKDIKRCVIDWLGHVVYEGYAASEGGGTFVNSADWLRFPGTVGKAIPGAEISIRSPDSEELPRGKEGLVYIRPYTGDRFEYLGNPEATRKCYIGDQFTVGDIGYLNEDGYLFLLDRAVNLIICAGENIYPAEIEAVITSHPLVADCAVIGKPDADFGETIHAVIQPSMDCTLDESGLRMEIVRFAYRRLAAGKLPRSMEFVKNLPRDPNGKLLKRRLSSPS
jgi:long-chain acyl-CoA synthetase